MHVYEYEDEAEETQYSFVLQVQKTYDKLTRIWWSCYGNSHESLVLNRYHETKKLEPNKTYRIIKVTKHITRSWEVLETPYEII